MSSDFEVTTVVSDIYMATLLEVGFPPRVDGAHGELVQDMYFWNTGLLWWEKRAFQALNKYARASLSYRDVDTGKISVGDYKTWCIEQRKLAENSSGQG